MRKYIVILMILSTFLVPMAVSAQNPVEIASLDIAIWPEYDKPIILVLYDITLSPNTILPTDLSFQIPIEVGEPNGYGYYSDEGGPPLQEGYSYNIVNNYAVVTFTTRSLHAHFEYYDPQLLKHGNERNFVYTWPGDYDVASLTVQLQQPLDASNAVISPGEILTAAGSDGFIYHSTELGTQEAGTMQSVNISYIKSSDALSVESLQIQPSVPIDTDTSGRVNIMVFIPWILGGLGIVLVFGGVFWYWRAGQEPSQKRKTKRGGRTQNKPQPSSGSADEAIYCHQCGKRAAGNDRFCRSCGSKLRL